MRIRLAVPDRIISPAVLEAALEASTRANEELLRRGERPTVHEMIRDGLRWRPEPYTDGEHFDLGDVIARRKWADCDDIAPAYAADRRVMGDHAARAVVRRSGPSRWHVVVRTGDGRELDPSRWAGMGERAHGVAGVAAMPMAPPGQGAIALVPWRDGRWWARADMPAGGYHWAAVARGRDPVDAMATAVDRCVMMGECAGDVDGPSRMHDVGFSFGSLLSRAADIATSVVPGAGLARSAIQAAAPLAQGLLSQFGGHGADAHAPVAHAPAPVPGASGMVSHALPGGRGMVAYNPHYPGPIIVRF